MYDATHCIESGHCTLHYMITLVDPSLHFLDSITISEYASNHEGASKGATEGKGSLTLEHIICAYIKKVNMSNRSVT